MTGLDKRDGDIVASIAICGLGAFIYWHASTLPSGAAGFPMGIAVALILCSLLLLIRSIRRPREGRQVAAGYRWSLLIVSLAMLAVVVAVLEKVGFFIPAAVFMAVLSWILAGRPVSASGIIRPLVYGAVGSVALWLIFVKVLSVAIPT